MCAFLRCCLPRSSSSLNNITGTDRHISDLKTSESFSFDDHFTVIREVVDIRTEMSAKKIA